MSIEEKTFGTKQLIKMIESNNIIIYGTGYVAKRFINVLKKYGLYRQIKYITATNLKENNIDNIPCIKLSEIKELDKFLICIAVHESLKDEIIKKLEEMNIDKYVWIYPNLYELLLGKTVKENVCVPIKNIWLVNRENYIMAVRYLAIDNYYAKNNYGYEIYKMAMSLFSDIKTSENRLNQFIKLIESWEKNGYDESKPALIQDNYSVIDGAHRISLASYFNIENIVCNIYSSKDIKEPVHDKEAVFDKSLVQELNIDKGIVDILEETNKRIDKQYDL